MSGVCSSVHIINAFVRVAEENDLESVQWFIDAGVPLNDLDDAGWTALGISSFFGHDEIVQLLIDNNADVNSPGEYGNTALSHAKAKERTKVVKILTEVGA